MTRIIDPFLWSHDTFYLLCILPSSFDTRYFTDNTQPSLTTRPEHDLTGEGEHEV